MITRPAVGDRFQNTISKLHLDSPKLTFPIGVWVASRIVILVWAVVVVSFLPVRQLNLVGGNPILPPGPANTVIEPWLRWDTLWYLRIAQQGYSRDDMTGGFFPLYPILINGFTRVTGNTLLSALIISNLATLASLLLFHRMARRLYGDAVARRAVLYWVAFPTSFYLFAGYAEPVFVLFSLIAVQAAATGSWPRAGIGGALAALARPPGTLVLIPLGIEWLASRCSIGVRVRRALPLLLIPAAMMLFMLYLYYAFGDPFFWANAWKNIILMPWDLAGDTVRAIANGQGVGNNLIDLTFTLFVFGLSVIGLRRIPISLSAFALSLVIVQLMAYQQALGLTDIPMAAMARRVAVVFPAFLVLAQVWHGRLKEPLWFAVSAGVQLLFISIFVRWLWLD